MMVMVTRWTDGTNHGRFGKRPDVAPSGIGEGVGGIGVLMPEPLLLEIICTSPVGLVSH